MRKWIVCRSNYLPMLSSQNQTSPVPCSPSFTLKPPRPKSSGYEHKTQRTRTRACKYKSRSHTRLSISCPGDTEKTYLANTPLPFPTQPSRYRTPKIRSLSRSSAVPGKEKLTYRINEDSAPKGKQQGNWWRTCGASKHLRRRAPGYNPGSVG